MTVLTPQRLYAAIDATWPARAFLRAGPWMLRDGAGGGKRVSAATAEAPVAPADLAAAETGMAGLGQAALFMIRAGEESLDAMLAEAGYRMIDPVVIRAAATAPLAAMEIPRLTAFTVWEPLAIQRDIWAAGGIGPARIDVMHRVRGPHTSLFGRIHDSPGGTGFVAVHDGLAMLHALEILKTHRRAGLGRWLTLKAAQWAAEQGASHMAILTVRDNEVANGLYASMGFDVVGQYHYRIKEGPAP